MVHGFIAALLRRHEHRSETRVSSAVTHDGPNFNIARGLENIQRQVPPINRVSRVEHGLLVRPGRIDIRSRVESNQSLQRRHPSLRNYDVEEDPIPLD